MVGAGAGVQVRFQLPAPAPLYCTVYKIYKIINDILFVSSHIDKRLFKKRKLLNNDIFLVRKKEWSLNNFG